MSSPFRSQSTRSVLWDVLAPYVRWPLYSPARLGVVILAVLVGFTACSKMTAPSPSAAPTQTVTVTAPASSTEPTTVSSETTTSPTASAPATSSKPTVTASPRGAATAAAPSAKANTPVAVADSFVSAWARRGADATSWKRGVTPYCTPAFATMLARTNPSRIPATKRLATGTLKSQRGTTSAVQVPTDGGDVLVTLTRAGNTWRVADLAPVDQAPAASTPPMTPLPTASAKA